MKYLLHRTDVAGMLNFNLNYGRSFMSFWSLKIYSSIFSIQSTEILERGRGLKEWNTRKTWEYNC